MTNNRCSEDEKFPRGERASNKEPRWSLGKLSLQRHTKEKLSEKLFKARTARNGRSFFDVFDIVRLSAFHGQSNQLTIALNWHSNDKRDKSFSRNLQLKPKVVS